MSTRDSRFPVPCRHFHTPQGCPYGRWCKYDHYSNNPSYLNYVKQKLHQISKPVPQKSNHKHNENMVHVIVESVQKCIADIIKKEFRSLYQEITALKTTIERQSKMIQNNHSKHIAESTFTKHVHKITKLLKQNHAAIHSKKKSNNKPSKVPKISNDEHEWSNIFTKIRTQLKDLQSDKQLFETQITSFANATNNTQLAHKHTAITTLAPPKSNKCARRKLQRKPDPSPFDNISQDENIFETPTNTTSVTMDQISSLPAPPKRKPNLTKKNKTNIKLKKSREKHVLVQTNSKKTKHNYNKPHIHKKQCHRSKSKKKQNHKHNHSHSSVLKENDARPKMAPLKMNWMNDTDWYQIVPTDSSEDDEANMTTDDVAKLDMLGSI